VGPCLIKEVLYPFNLAEEVRPYIEAAITAHNQSNYIFALENYQLARVFVIINYRKYGLKYQKDKNYQNTFKYILSL